MMTIVNTRKSLSLSLGQYIIK